MNKNIKQSLRSYDKLLVLFKWLTMPFLKEQVFDICKKLAHHGWADWIRQVHF
jgi:hypothetical protein